MTKFGKLSKLKENPRDQPTLPIIHIKPNFKEDIPDAYIKGWIEFFKLKFKVTPDVLIPRPETELLVDEVLAFIGSDPMLGTGSKSPRTKKGPTLTILDVGTGAGNIAIAIAKNSNVHPRGVNINIFATDVSPNALEVAKENARKNKVDKRIFFIQSDLLSFHKPVNQSTNNSRSLIMHPLNPDIIVANLPYIPSSRIPYLDSSVKDFEPILALDGGPDGFDLYRKLFQQIRTYNPGLDLNLQTGIGKLKLIVCEIDYTHGELAIQEAQRYFPEAKAEVKTDLAHKQRVLLIRF